MPICSFTRVAAQHTASSLAHRCRSVHCFMPFASRSQICMSNRPKWLTAIMVSMVITCSKQHEKNG
jgi:hypothetical protein